MSDKKKNLYLFWGYFVILILCAIKFARNEEVNNFIQGALLFHVPMIYNISYEYVDNVKWRGLIYLLYFLSISLIISIILFPSFSTLLAVLLDILTFLQFTTKRNQIDV